VLVAPWLTYPLFGGCYLAEPRLSQKTIPKNVGILRVHEATANKSFSGGLPPASDQASPSMAQPSLQEISEKKVLEQILQSDNPDADFASLEPRAQRLVFSRLRTEHARLLEVDQKWCALKSHCPSTDIEIYLNSRRTYEEDDEEDEQEDDQNGYDLQEIQNQWSYPVGAHENEDGGRENIARPAGNAEGVEATEEEGESLEAKRNVEWHKSNLVADSSDSDIRLCFHNSGPWCDCMSRWLNTRRLSSQLLFYRLTVVFGMPPPREQDGYKSCWEVDLQYSDGASVLSFYDYKGAGNLRFSGTSKASDDALKLLTYLFGMKCLHTYDGIVAGTEA